MLHQPGPDLGAHDAADAQKDAGPVVDVGELVVGDQCRQGDHQDGHERGAHGFLGRVAEVEEQGDHQKPAAQAGERGADADAHAQGHHQDRIRRHNSAALTAGPTTPSTSMLFRSWNFITTTRV